MLYLINVLPDECCTTFIRYNIYQVQHLSGTTFIRYNIYQAIDWWRRNNHIKQCVTKQTKTTCLIQSMNANLTAIDSGEAGITSRRQNHDLRNSRE